MEDGDFGAKLIKSGDEWIQWSQLGNNHTPAAVMAFELDNGNVMEWTGWLSPAAYDRTLDALHGLGFTGDDLDVFNAQAPHGKCRVTVKTEEYKGRTTQKIAFVNAAVRRVKDEDRMSLADLKKLAAENKRGFDGGGFDSAGPPSETKAKRTAKKSPKDDPQADDDIPF